MEQEIDAMLYVEQGEPGEEGKTSRLSPRTFIIGRPFKEHAPDIPFRSYHVSKRHAELSYTEGRFILVDLGSKHGTEINGEVMLKEMPYFLKHNDRISLAHGGVRLRFLYESQLEKTLDFGGEAAPVEHIEPIRQPIAVDEDRKEVLLDGKELERRLRKREFELLSLLYRNVGRAVSYDAIRKWVWRDYSVPDVITDENVHSLVRDLKISLGQYAKYITSLPPGYKCYRLDLRA